MCDGPCGVRMEDLTWLVGRREIARYVRRSEDTVTRWRKKYGFPAVLDPGKRLVTTVTLVDQWLQARGAVYRERERLCDANPGVAQDAGVAEVHQ